MRRLTPYTKNLDERGGFLGITRDQWAEVNFIETSAGQVRGEHYHKETVELFFIISGEINISIEDVRTGTRNEFIVAKGDIFIVDPYEMHTFRTISDSQWINMLSHPLDPDFPDFHRRGKNLNMK